ncbi:MAG TPA: alpha-L-rhamnosidase C-terminal domain-containing protein [Blastocatellia bacterium]|nr:alpha-L-rhamnosidase C-terminal domain-containing protein [Blastocatellia bacterium]
MLCALCLIRSGLDVRVGAASNNINPELLAKAWSARWITVPGISPFEYGVYHFRRVFDLSAKPSSFIIHVTADNRYQLYVNGERVVWGPARGDLFHWRFETVDIARYLKPGKNALTAVVWNFAQHAPQAQTTSETGFLLQGNTEAERVVDTSRSWKCFRNPAYQPLPVTHGEMRGYFVAGPGDRVDAAIYPWGWEAVDFDDSAWPAAKAENPGSPRDAQDGPDRRMLVPRNIPLMEEQPERILSLRQSEGVTVPASFPKQAAPFQIPPHAKARLLLDQTYLTTAYPELLVSGGRGATISMAYAEALMVKGDYKGHFQKGNRNEVEGKIFVGYKDVFVADGGAKRLFRPLWWRTYRYIELNVETQAEPLTIEDLRGVYTGYPFERKARFDAGSAELQKILDVGWRTARLCAHETYMDCPYYEQLQYAGDTRIQALVSLYMTGDVRLMRNAISQLDDSRTAEGATYSRAPTRLQQYIPPFSLWWIGMVHDYWMYQDEPDFVRRMLPGVRAVLSFFAARQKPQGSLGPLPWWNFVDWTKEWQSGVPPREADGSSAPLDLQLLLAYGWAVQMEDALGSKALAAEYRRAEAQLRSAAQQLYWDAGRRLYADTPKKADFSQHTNVLAILAGMIEGEQARDLLNRILADNSLVQCSIYFRHYLHSAVNKAGEGDRYLDLLGEWRAMLDRGLTTWAETADPARSDCHAWGSSPNYELFRTVLGIDSAAPGFRRVVIQPFPGKLKQVSGAIPHPKGEVAVSLRLSNGKMEAEVSLPEGVKGEFIWRGARRPLSPGKSKLSL